MKTHNSFEQELAVLRRSVVDAIHAQDEFGVEQGLEVYERLVRTFVQKLKDLGATYDRRSADKEISESLGGGWPALEWIRHDYSRILRAAVSAENFSIINHVLYFPTTIAWIAFEYDDYLSLSYFLAFPALAYSYAQKIEDLELRQLVTDKIARFPREFADFGLAPRLEHAESGSDIAWVKELSEGIVAIFNPLLKEAIDKGDRIAFVLFLKHFHDLFEHYDQLPGYTEWAVFEDEGLPVPEPRNDFFVPLRALIRELKRLKDIVKLGLIGWMVRLIKSGRPAQAFADWVPHLGWDGGLETVTSTYLLSRRTKYESLLRWDWWWLEGQEEGVAHWGGFEQYLDVAYLIVALRTITPNANHTPLESFSRHDIYLIEENGSLIRTLAEIESQVGVWAQLIPDLNHSKFNALREVFQRTIENQRQVREQQVVAATLSDVRIEAFAAAEEKGYRNEPELFTLMKSVGSVQEVVETARPDRSWGFYEILPKDWFVEDSDIEITIFGEQHGQNLRYNVANRILKEILQALPRQDLRENLEPSELLRESLRALRDLGASPIIIVVGHFRLREWLRKDPRFVPLGPGWYSQKGTQIGWIDDIEVHGIHFRGESAILVCDLKRVGSWVRMVLTDLKPGERILAEEMRFIVRPIPEEEAKRWVAERPDIHRKSKGEGQETVEEAVARLRQRVVHHLTVATEFEIKDPSFGVAFRKAGEPQDPNGEEDEE